MFRSGVLALVIFLAGCGGNDSGNDNRPEKGTAQPFATYFKEMKPPYALSDSGLLANKDTTVIRSEAWKSVIPDSIILQVFGKKDKVKFISLAQFKGKKGETYFLAKGIRDSRTAALIVVSSEAADSTSVLPFLVPDSDKATRQITSMEANFSIIRTTVRKGPDDVFQEGKDVYAYSDIGKTFDLVMTDPLSDEKGELLNPIDTLAKTYKWAGDYGKDKRNIVSVRDGRKQGLITVFIHIDKGDGDCTGEIKGDAEIIDEQTAIYRTAGDPCILTLKFGKSGVTLEEQEGCGSRRGLECSFNGTFNRKKEAGAASAKKK